MDRKHSSLIVGMLTLSFMIGALFAGCGTKRHLADMVLKKNDLPVGSWNEQSGSIGRNASTVNKALVLPKSLRYTEGYGRSFFRNTLIVRRQAKQADEVFSLVFRSKSHEKARALFKAVAEHALRDKQRNHLVEIALKKTLGSDTIAGVEAIPINRLPVMAKELQAAWALWRKGDLIGVTEVVDAPNRAEKELERLALIQNGRMK